jgi:hypothetical protein
MVRHPTFNNLQIVARTAQHSNQFTIGRDVRLLCGENQ